MPITRSAKKALRQTKKRTAINEKIKLTLKKALKEAKKNPNLKNLKISFSALDRAAKKNIIHPRKANRLKSRLAKLAKNKKKK